ncbi:MAG: diguanylate cyclase [Acidobacteriia bacterium]|nr:diguanylate cyclase [Terriglobia bacterium]
MRVLIADDDDVLRHILEATLVKWGYEVVVARNGLEAWRLLQSNDAPKLAILDWIMPGMDGVEVCREIRKREDRPYIYLLLLTSKHKKEDVIAGLEAGADDYIPKPFDPQELKMRVRAGRRILDLQAELLSARETLRYQATHDGLTGLLNRSAALDALRNELERANRQSIPLCLMLADFDHFKDINDTHGHTIGDAVLCEATRRMRASVRTYDSVGRYGGEEFLFILPGCDTENAKNQAERLQACVTSQPIELPRVTISFTISIGVVVKYNACIEDLDSLIQTADAALYEAKVQGRNRVVVSATPVAVLKPIPTMSFLEPRA